MGTVDGDARVRARVNERGGRGVACVRGRVSRRRARTLRRRSRNASPIGEKASTMCRFDRTRVMKNEYSAICVMSWAALPKTALANGRTSSQMRDLLVVREEIGHFAGVEDVVDVLDHGLAFDLRV